MTDVMELEQGAERLVEMLPERERQLLQDVAEQMSLPLWMLVCGLLLRVVDMGEQTAPALPPDWLASNPVVRERVLPDVDCPICGQRFTPKWMGQVYDRVECGAVAARRGRAGGGGVAVAPVGREPEGVVKSTLVVAGAAGAVGDAAASAGGEG